MAKKIEEMSAELSKLKLEKKNWNKTEGGNKNFNQFKKPYNAKIL